MHTYEIEGVMVQHININNLDLNLLRVFDAVYRESSILRAAQRLGLSQPATSHAIGRLRRALDDDLFVRTANGMMPTHRAEKLAGHVSKALEAIETALRTEAFDPASSAHTFRLAMDNFSAITMTGRLMAAVETAAPNVRLDIRPSGTIDVDRLMDEGELDLFIGRKSEVRERFASKELTTADFVVVCGNDAMGEKMLSIDELVARPHLHLSSTGDDTSFLDTWLAARGQKREIKHSVPLLGCIPLIGKLDAFVVVRRPLAETLAEMTPIGIAELPFHSPRLTTCLRWHRRLDPHPAHRWLRDLCACLEQ